MRIAFPLPAWRSPWIAATILGALFLVAWRPALQAEPFAASPAFSPAVIAQVTGAALAFMEPRTLDAVGLPKLALWGFGGLTALDPRLAVERREGMVRLLFGATPIAARPPPGDGDADGWGATAGLFARAAWDASERVRRAGTEGVIQAMFDATFARLDPYSRYTPPGAAEQERNRREGRAGVGITVGEFGGAMVLAAVVADSPAARAGLRPGERVLAVDGQSTQGVDTGAVNALVDGLEGSDVALTVRGRDERVRTVTLRRGLVPPETVISARAGSLLTIRVTAFATATAERIGSEIERLLAAGRGARGVVIDLRGNRGGVLQEAVATASELLDGGTVAVTVGRSPEADHSFVATGPDRTGGLPIVVLVDGQTASAAEILAAALGDQGRAVVVGSTTFGKGVVQTVAPLPNGGELFLTWSRVLAPRGWPVQGLGVMPQLCTGLGRAAFDEVVRELGQGRQPLERALQRHREARAPLSAEEAVDIRAACPATDGAAFDMEAARFLLDHRAAYQTALLPPEKP